MYQAYYRKYRPQTFDEVYGQRHITATLKNQVAADRVSHAYLFTGTRGTGKTTCAKILARAVNCEHPVNGNPCNVCPSCRGILDGSILDVLELDAASNTGVDNIRAILDETTYPPANVRKRVYIIDEVHMLSAGAFNALLKTLEEPPEYVMFILATTELHRVAATILSRCQRFDFKRVDPKEIAANISTIADKEQFKITPKALELLSKLADGSVRDSLSLLERCMMGHEDTGLDENAVVEAMGISSSETLSSLVDAIASQNAASALLALDRIYMDGRDIRSTLERLAAYFRDVLLYQTAPEAAEALSAPGFDHDGLLRDAKRFSPRHVMDITAALQKSMDSIQRTSGGRLEAELCLIGLCSTMVTSGDTAELAGRIAAIETRLSSGAVVLPVQSGTADNQSGSGEKAVDTSEPNAKAQPVAAESHAVREAPPARAAGENRQKTDQPSGKAALNEMPDESKIALLKAVMPQLPRSVYTQLTLCQMFYKDQVLTLVREGEMTAMMLDKPEIRNTVAQAAARILGEECKVRVLSSEAQKRDAAFEGFDAIISGGREAGVKIDIT